MQPAIDVCKVQQQVAVCMYDMPLTNLIHYRFLLIRELLLLSLMLQR
jgi:hypothetical protein